MKNVLSRPYSNLHVVRIIKVTLVSRIYPTSQTISNIWCIAMCSSAILKISWWGNCARIVDSGCFVESDHITSLWLVDALSKTVSWFRPSSPFADHFKYNFAWTGILDLVSDIWVASSCTIVVLHQTRIANTKIRCWYTNTASWLLHDDSKNKAMIHLGLLGHLLDSIVDCAKFWFIIVRHFVLLAGAEHSFLTIVKPKFVSKRGT